MLEAFYQTDKEQLDMKGECQVPVSLTFSAAFPYGSLTSVLCHPSSMNFPELGPCLSVSVPVDRSDRGVQPFQPEG